VSKPDDLHQIATEPSTPLAFASRMHRPKLSVGGLLTKGRQATLSSPSHGAPHPWGAPPPNILFLIHHSRFAIREAQLRIWREGAQS
jgi:hypothetical protein